MTFYTGLRDDTAAPLIAQFGQPAVYRTFEAAVYDNATGLTTTGAPTDLPIKMLELPARNVGSTAAQEFSEEVTSKMSALLLVSAKEFAAASVNPTVDQTVVYAGRTTRILAIKRVAPGGVAVIYKMAVQYA